MLVDPHLLRTFVTVAETGSFSRAAQHLGYTQSAVSQQVAALEADLGVELLRRRPVTPTPAGDRLLEHARPILLRLDAARADVRRAVAVPPARLVLGATPLAAASRVAAALAVLRRATPHLEVRLRVTDRASVAAGVATGDLDAGLIDGVTAPNDPLRLPDVGPLTVTGVAEERLVVALPPDHPLAARAGLRLADLIDADWLDAPDAATPLADLRTVAGPDGFRPSLTYRGTDVTTAAHLVAAGHGLALLPTSALPTHPTTAAVPLVSPNVVHRTELLHATPVPPPVPPLKTALSPARESAPD
jgi:DNA-binding transcriptional LysR family regulator